MTPLSLYLEFESLLYVGYPNQDVTGLPRLLWTLLCRVCGFKHLWADPAQMTVPTGAIIKGLDVLIDLGSPREDLFGRQAAFDGERFDRRLEKAGCLLHPP